MINWFLKLKTKDLITSFNNDSINQSEKVLFCLFTRYGDTVIDIEVIKEFIFKYPKKNYLILCPKQMSPYIETLIPSIDYFAFNKRNPLSFMKAHLLLKSWSPDIAYNPWSNGLDSYYFCSYATFFRSYKDFQKPNNINHYEVVRKYLGLDSKKWTINKGTLKKNYTRVLICPESTDHRRSMTIPEIIEIITKIKKACVCEFTIAHLNMNFKISNVSYFKFSKNANSSRKFLNLVQSSDLIVSCDSAPLHIASALGKDLLPIFKSTNAAKVINSGSKVIELS